MRARFGDRVRLVPIAAERRRRWFLPRFRRPSIERDPAALLDRLFDWCEARLLWARFGL